MRLTILLGVTLTLMACTTVDESTFEREYQTKLQGTITKKTQLSERDVQEKRAHLKRQMVFDTIAINLLTAPLGIFVYPTGQITTDTHEYEVSLESGRTVYVLSQFNGFNVGECVNLFLSANWEAHPPRMAYSTTACSLAAK
jgi:hypothetical protein